MASSRNVRASKSMQRAIGIDDRGKGFESKWAHDAELRFKVEARRNRLIGSWAAEKKGLSGDDAEQFVLGVIAAAVQEAGDEDVCRKLRSEFDASVSDAAIREQMRECLNNAVAEVSAAK